MEHVEQIEQCPHCGGPLTTESEEPEYGPGDAGTRRTEERARFLRGAKRELAELIREIEGPNPPPAPRRR